jgi:transcriptional regulator with XRE-family HTH domain
MQKSIFSREQIALQRLLRRLREDADLLQSDVAGRLGRPQPFVSRYEKGEKLLDLVELRQVCHAIGTTLPELVRLYEEELARCPP